MFKLYYIIVVSNIPLLLYNINEIQVNKKEKNVVSLCYPERFRKCKNLYKE
ncbi:unnamed protein product [marine sediment metagenome]|uniref:Uncharacterized protein n=1 Tax=marine sediment metagenome TaxID=412755 RepID=X1CUE5_9ZZZZ